MSLGLGAASQERAGDLHCGFKRHQPRGSEKANTSVKLEQQPALSPRNSRRNPALCSFRDREEHRESNRAPLDSSSGNGEEAHGKKTKQKAKLASNTGKGH